MPGSRFVSPLCIAAGKIMPSGPLDLTDGWPTGTTAQQVTAAKGKIEVYVWVVQQLPDDVGAFMLSKATHDTVDPDLTWRTPLSEPVGHFQPGPALGIAVQVWKDPNGRKPTRVFWWTDAIILQADDQPTAY